jgi:ubiquinone/menaquinone biosynthesis C-methylase UbiE
LNKIQYADLGYLLLPEVFLQTYELLIREQQYNWEGHDCLHVTRRIEYPWAETELDPQHNDDILDVGCGKTIFGLNLVPKVKSIICIDLDLTSINYLKNKYIDHLKKIKGSFSAQIGDILNLNFKDNQFDKTCCISTLEHLEKEQINSAINELLRVTKLGGRVIITMDVTEKQSNFAMTDIDALVKRFNLNWGKSLTKPLFEIGETIFTLLLIRIDK